MKKVLILKLVESTQPIVPNNRVALLKDGSFIDIYRENVLSYIDEANVKNRYLDLAKDYDYFGILSTDTELCRDDFVGEYIKIADYSRLHAFYCAILANVNETGVNLEDVADGFKADPNADDPKLSKKVVFYRKFYAHFSFFDRKVIDSGVRFVPDYNLFGDLDFYLQLRKKELGIPFEVYADVHSSNNGVFDFNREAFKQKVSADHSTDLQRLFNDHSFDLGVASGLAIDKNTFCSWLNEHDSAE